MNWITERRYQILYALRESDHGLAMSNICDAIEEIFGEEHAASTIAKSIVKLQELDLVEKDVNKVYHLQEPGPDVVQHLAEIDKYGLPDILDKEGDRAEN